MNFLELFLEKIDDRLNPIVVKELRQAVKGKFLIVILLIFLAVQLATMGMFISDSSVRPDFYLGKNVFMTLFGFLMAASMLVIPGYAGVRLAAERTENNMDLLFITTLTPARIIRGKFFAALVLALLMFSTAMPFMTFTYFLRGIDLPTIFLFLILGFLGSGLAIQFALFLACIPFSYQFRLLLAPVGIPILISYLSMVFAIADDLIRTGLGPGMWFGDTFFLLLSWFLLFLIAWGFWYVLAVACISPPTANRAFPVRVYTVFAWVVTAVLAITVQSFKSGFWPVQSWAILSTMVLGVGFFIAASERETVGPRILGAVPNSAIGRRLAFLFCSGSAGGVTWGVLMLLATLGVFILSGTYLGRPTRSFEFEEIIETCLGIGMFFYCYALTAVMLRRWIFHDWFSHETTWLFALILAVLGSLLSPILGFMFFGDSSNDAFILNPFVSLSSDRLRPTMLIILFFWSGTATTLLFSWFRQQYQQFSDVNHLVNRQSETLST